MFVAKTLRAARADASACAGKGWKSARLGHDKDPSSFSALNATLVGPPGMTGLRSSILLLPHCGRFVHKAGQWMYRSLRWDVV